MRTSSPVTAILCALAVLVGVALSPQAASALIIDFSLVLPVGDTGSPTYTSGPVTAEAFYKSGGAYINTDATLFVHTVDGTQGFGVCSPVIAGCGVADDELDNLGADEMIRLTLAPGWRWVRAWVSSLQSGPNPDTGQLLHGTLPTLSDAALLDGFSGADTSTGELELPITGPAAGHQYLFFIPEPGFPGNDNYLVWQVEVEQVPEPATLLLLGAGLAALGALGRKRSCRP